MHSIWSCDSSIYILWGCFPGTGTLVTCTWHGQVIMKNMGNISQYEIITKHNITRCKLYTCCLECTVSINHIWSSMGIDIIIPPASTKLKGRYTAFTLSVCASVRLWTEWCPLCIFNNTCWIHFIFLYLIKQLQKVCCVFCLWQNSNIWILANFLNL